VKAKRVKKSFAAAAAALAGVNDEDVAGSSFFGAVLLRLLRVIVELSDMHVAARRKEDPEGLVEADAEDEVCSLVVGCGL